MKILFMGTPDFAVFSLKALIAAGHEICGVVTQPDKPKGRGYVLTPPPVKVVAEQAGIPVYQPQTLRDEAFADLLSTLDPEICVVVAYGKILPLNVLEYPKFGCVNVHGSLLPEYRGAAPMQRAIIDGKKVTGVTTMYMAEGLDTGDMLLKSEVEITPDDNFETLHDKLANDGAKLAVSTIKLIEAGIIVPQKQDDSLATYASKIENVDCIIDFNKKSTDIVNQIRALSPVPLAQCSFHGKSIKLVSAIAASGKGRSGEIIALNKDSVVVACGEDTAIAITELKPEGKKSMSAKDCINGRMFSIGDILE